VNARSRPRQGAANDLAGGRITAQHTAACTDDVATDASRRRDRIKLLLGSIAETTEKLADLIEAARDGEDHVVLGFASWTAYVAAEFSGLLTGLGTAERRVAVHALSVSGMPTRAIAEVAGISQSTAARDARVSHDDSPVRGVAACETFVLADGSEIAVSADELFMGAVSDDEFEVALTTARQQGDLSSSNVVRLLGPRVTGVDGRSYAQQAPRRTQRRRALPDAYDEAVHDLVKVLERLARLHRDDRFAANREAVRGRNHGPLARHCDELGALLAELTGGAR